MSKEVQIGVQAKLSVQTEGQDKLEALAASSAEADKALTALGKNSESALSGMLERLNQNLEAMSKIPDAAKAATPKTYQPGQTNYQSAERILDNAMPKAMGAQYESDFKRLESQLNTARGHIQNAKSAGLDTSTLEEKLEAATKEIGELHREFADTRRNAQTQAATPTQSQQNTPQQNPMLESATQLLQRYGGAGLGQMGMLGNLLKFGGGFGLALGAGSFAINAAQRFFEAETSKGREEVMNAADLARQYNYAGNPNTLFRDANGVTKRELFNFGYSAKDAARVASIYDQPLDMREGTTNILQFSRTTGIDETRAASMQRGFRVSGLTDSRDSLETLKYAMIEGVSRGISQADTLRGISSMMENNYRQGKSNTQETLAFNAALVSRLAQTNNPLFKGERGAETAEKLSNAALGNDDLSVQVMLGNRLGGAPSAEELGLTGTVAKNYENLRVRNPIMALQMATKLDKRGKFTTRAAGALQDSMGGDMSLMLAYLQSTGLSPEEALQAAGDFSGYFKDAQKNQGGRSALASDPQGRNPADQAARARAIQQEDLAYRDSMASLRAFSGLDKAFTDLTNTFKEGGIALKNFFADLQGAPSLFQDPVNYRALAGSSYNYVPNSGQAVSTNLLYTQNITPAGQAVQGSNPVRTPSEFVGRTGADQRYLRANARDLLPMLQGAGFSDSQIADPIPDSVARAMAAAAAKAGAGENDPKRAQAAREAAAQRVWDDWYKTLTPTQQTAMNQFVAGAEAFDFMGRQQAQTQTRDQNFQSGVQQMGGTAITQRPGQNANNPALGYGARGHRGFDVRIGQQGVGGEFVRSPFTLATVVSTGSYSAGGQQVKLKFPSGHTAIIGHLEKVMVAVGQTIKRGDVIGTEGKGGTGYHIHLELRPPNQDSYDAAYNTEAEFLSAFEAINASGYAPTGSAPAATGSRPSTPTQTQPRNPQTITNTALPSIKPPTPSTKPAAKPPLPAPAKPVIGNAKPLPSIPSTAKPAAKPQTTPKPQTAPARPQTQTTPKPQTAPTRPQTVPKPPTPTAPATPILPIIPPLFPNAPTGNVNPNTPSNINVTVSGLENIVVTGLKPEPTRAVQTAVRSIAEIVSNPQNHKGD